MLDRVEEKPLRVNSPPQVQPYEHDNKKKRCWETVRGVSVPTCYVE